MFFMAVSQIYVMIAIAVLIVIVGVVFLMKKDRKREGLGPLAGVAFGFIIAGIVFADSQWFSYGLFGVGIVLAIIDVVLKGKR